MPTALQAPWGSAGREQGSDPAHQVEQLPSERFGRAHALAAGASCSAGSKHPPFTRLAPFQASTHAPELGLYARAAPCAGLSHVRCPLG